MSEAVRVNSPEVTVSELSASLKRTLEDAYGYVRVRGELGKVSYHSNGHVYFDLKDERACISGVIWRSTAGRMKLKLETGLEVVASGRITTYAGRSQYQLIVESVEPAGLGALMALLDERKRRLAAEGVFDEARKQLLPFLPRVIGIVTSPTGAVIRDILHRLADRFPRRVILWPVRVQGDGSAEEVAAAIRGLNAIDGKSGIPAPDLIIVARGGGSLEDLWSFNEEIVVRAAAESLIPLISAIGHETDVTLIDFAADRRAPTPTAAAEMAVPVRAELLAQVDGLSRRTRTAWLRAIETRRKDVRAAARALPTADRLLGERRQRLDALAARLPRALKANAQIHRTALTRATTRLARHTPHAQLVRQREGLQARAARAQQAFRIAVARRRDRLNNIGDRLSAAARANRAAHAAKLARDRTALGVLSDRAQRAMLKLIDRKWTSLERAAGLLSALSYHGVLARGFALVRDAGGHPIRTATAVAPGAALDIEFADGRAAVVATGAHASAASAPLHRPRRKPRGPAPGQGSLF
jgi:exodeoxyribonuclease VII large subunit